MDMAVARGATSSAWSLGGGVAGIGLRPVTNIAAESGLLTQRSYGKIVVENRRLIAVHGRWWPYLGDLLQVAFDSRFPLVREDRCELYYHVSRSSPDFLTLGYVHSGPRTSLGTLYAATLILDEIARLKRSSAIVCNVTNDRISHRLFERWNWEQHCLDWPGRHYIKRLYGQFPTIDSPWRERLTMGSL